MIERNKMLHRVPIKPIKRTVACPFGCAGAEACLLCNEFYEKCTIYNSWRYRMEC